MEIYISHAVLNIIQAAVGIGLIVYGLRSYDR